MKPKNYSTFLLAFISVIFISSFPSCKSECTTQPDETFLLSSSDKAQIVYTGKDTLKFLHNSIDTIVFIGHGKQPYLEVESVTGGDCPGGNKNYEGYNITYVSSQYSSKIYFSHHLYLSGGSEVTVDFNDASFGYSLTGVLWGKDTIKTLNQTFYNACHFYTNSNKTDTLCFNKSIGILKISTLSDKWEIIKP